MILTSDRGFCGGFNANLLREAQRYMIREGPGRGVRVELDDKPEKSPPFFWAAFVVSTDRP